MNEKKKSIKRKKFSIEKVESLSPHILAGHYSRNPEIQEYLLKFAQYLPKRTDVRFLAGDDQGFDV